MKNKQRVIKFRAFHKKEKKMYEDYNIGVPEKGWPTNLNIVLEDCQEEFILMQFTGLKSKSGKEIFEGDICKTGRPIGEDRAESCEIKWIDAGLKCKSGMMVWALYDDEAKKLEVIGNVWENPKLLK